MPKQRRDLITGKWGGTRPGAGRPRKPRDANGNIIAPHRLQESWRQRIMTGKVINRLNKIALGEIKGAPISVQISAALGLLKKTMPDLSHVENAGGRTLDEIMFAAAVLAKTLPNDGWKLPSTPPPPIDLEALPLKLLDEADGGE